MVGHTELESTRRSRRIGVRGGIGVSVDSLDHHGNGCTITWIVVELLNGCSCVGENDVVVVGNTGRSQRDVASCSLTKHGDLGTGHPVWVAVLGHRLPEEANRCAAVLNPAVSRLDQLKRALRLCSRCGVPTQAIIAAGHDISLLGKLSTDGHGRRVVLVAQGAAIHILWQEVTCVEVQDQWTIRLRISRRLVEVEHQRLGRRWLALQSRNHRDVGSVLHVWCHRHVRKHLIDVSNPLAVDLPFGQSTQSQSHTRGVVVDDLIDPAHGFCFSHGGVQCQLRGHNGCAVCIIIGLGGCFAPPLPWGTVKGFSGHSFFVVAVEHREESIPTIVDV